MSEVVAFTISIYAIIYLVGLFRHYEKNLHI